MSKTRVVHCKKEPFDVYIGRPGKWGNPFWFTKYPVPGFAHQERTREESIALFRNWIMTKPELLRDLKDLKGKVLGCWCSPKPCHGDVLVELANEQIPE